MPEAPVQSFDPRRRSRFGILPTDGSYGRLIVGGQVFTVVGIEVNETSAAHPRSMWKEQPMSLLNRRVVMSAIPVSLIIVPQFILWFQPQIVSGSDTHDLLRLTQGIGAAWIFFGLLVAGYISLVRYQQALEAQRRAQRDEYAADARNHRIAFGTRLSEIREDHPYWESFRLRWGAAGSPEFRMPDTPWWSDVPLMDETWWRIATGPESEVPGLFNRLKAESKQRYQTWRADLRATDRDTYNEMIEWERHQETLAIQRQLVAQQARQAAATERLVQEQRRAASQAMLAQATAAGQPPQPQSPFMSDDVRWKWNTNVLNEWERNRKSGR
ncbi:MAG: hypothetical protein R2689_09330 [Microthrixaceae bacterium]